MTIGEPVLSRTFVVGDEIEMGRALNELVRANPEPAQYVLEARLNGLPRTGVVEARWRRVGPIQES